MFYRRVRLCHDFPKLYYRCKLKNGAVRVKYKRLEVTSKHSEMVGIVISG
ncbi:hypothetical protein LEP1GSC171_1143 [Leptospira santarosai str. HAI1380]|uniref:Uncharacterized protein n=2 Tax=Leptospira santarosai TaxID=28183 RepID=M6UW24_9LEPT|nr:hypothetical protein LEP1GSC068_1805 [Leptospira sp. Fiocruz LV3954]EKS06579.1 hypothetical protein LEP1GSC071_1468 [Leptospira santarosai str. JET]EMJ47336.1 hypothetical protein LEP1GSC169_2153 [Leptospira santarosai str. HAI1349]EMN19634.1 hypothetical protein LEP1GSC063_2304 [Leptospira santarosai serovar Arenal str. MAVJ 401]EMO12971.1 hypothetical protein LEP1GSC165_1871 [Leptospira santarosai str. CBC523]EMO23827.1 hypothetical protein LEP1GSC168_2757 [Leptospira santarosai str. HAI1